MPDNRQPFTIQLATPAIPRHSAEDRFDDEIKRFNTTLTYRDKNGHDQLTTLEIKDDNNPTRFKKALGDMCNDLNETDLQKLTHTLRSLSCQEGFAKNVSEQLEQILTFTQNEWNSEGDDEQEHYVYRKDQFLSSPSFHYTIKRNDNQLDIDSSIETTAISASVNFNLPLKPPYTHYTQSDLTISSQGANNLKQLVDRSAQHLNDSVIFVKEHFDVNEKQFEQIKLAIDKLRQRINKLNDTPTQQQLSALSETFNKLTQQFNQASQSYMKMALVQLRAIYNNIEDPDNIVDNLGHSKAIAKEFETYDALFSQDTYERPNFYHLSYLKPLTDADERQLGHKLKQAACGQNPESPEAGCTNEDYQRTYIQLLINHWENLEKQYSTIIPFKQMVKTTLEDHYGVAAITDFLDLDTQSNKTFQASIDSWFNKTHYELNQKYAKLNRKEPLARSIASKSSRTDDPQEPGYQSPTEDPEPEQGTSDQNKITFYTPNQKVTLFSDSIDIKDKEYFKNNPSP